MPDLTDVFEYLAVFGFFFLFLRALIALAKNDLKRPRKLPKSTDEFFKENGYTYDYVMVFKIYDEDYKKSMSSYQKKYSMKSVVDRIQASGMESRCFYSCQRDEVYVKVRCSPKRLMEEAGRIDYKLRLDKERLRIRVNNGSKQKLWKGFSIMDEKRVSSFDPYEYIYGPYRSSPEFQGLYQVYFVGDKKHIFRGVDRIKLILSILEAKSSDTPPGCEITIKDLAHHECVMAAFPIHEFDELKKLTLKWLTLFSPPWKQPIDDVKDYYGERIGIYFLYLQHYVTLLMIPAFLGAITYIVRVWYLSPENFLMPYFAVFMTLWSTFFVEFWKRTQSTAAMKWGVEGYESNEQDRPQFDGEEISSPINGKPEKYFAKNEKDYRARIANSVTMFAVLIVVLVVSGVFYLQVFMSSPAQIQLFTIAGYNTSNIITSLLSAVAIAILNMVYGSVSIILNDYENHRTDTEYEDNLISKIFIFQLVNSFAALTYVSFIKYFLGITCVKNDCIGDSASALSTIFIVRLITSAVVNVFVRKYMQRRKTAQESEGLEPGIVMSPVEEQYVLNEYGVLLGTLTDYAGLVIQYGYTVLFVAAFPLAPTLAFVSAYIQIRIDGWRLCQAHRRPQPKTAEDMGVWQEMLEIITILSVIYNFGLIFFTSHYLINVSWEYRWIMFIIAEHFMFAVKYLLSITIEDCPAEVHIQLERQIFLVSKVIDNLPDEVEMEYQASGKKTNIMIANTDYDWEDPEGAVDDTEDDFPEGDAIPEGEENKMPI